MTSATGQHSGALRSPDRQGAAPFLRDAMLVSVVVLVASLLFAGAVANRAYFYIRARRGAVPQPVVAD